ncbi:hypothetical protein [Pedobacter steynii]|uniref:Lipoprotein n=1 Tax=Pedobacter steynii TaxID=430522 RepID=A0A1D7QHE9_9SPHI|nr:hypothetical protein [Pedobacter steynii]AOM78091.1 hypothetical protein BFS30_13445 [Pedobacter steynii]
MNRFYFFMIFVFFCLWTACNRPGNKEHSKTEQTDTAAQLKEVKSLLVRFKTAIIKNDKPKLLNMIHFPMQTQMMWMNDELNAKEPDRKNGLINKEELLKYCGKELFDKEQQRVLAYELGDDVSVINLQTDQASNYYKSLASQTDPGTLLFNYYLQWERPDGKGDYWFGLVVGKVKGEFKLLSYYSKWPVKY